MQIHGCTRPFLGLALAAALAAAGPSPGAAQAQATGAILGRVTDAATARPIQGAQVSLVGTQRGVITSQTGDFQISGLAPGQHRVRVQYLGYATAETTVQVTGGGSAAPTSSSPRPPSTWPGWW